MNASSPIRGSASELSRRRFLLGGVGAGLLTSGIPLLSGCSSDSGQTSGSPTPTSSPVKGGTLTLGVSGGTSADTLDPLTATNNIDFQRALGLFDYGYYPDDDFVFQPQLIEESTSNKDATVWTVTLRDGIEFHNGKSLEAEDLIYTMQRMFDLPYSGVASHFSSVDVSGLKKRDRLTVEMPMKRPFSILTNQFVTLPIVPEDFDPKKPVGTGPFMFKSFSPGRESTFVRNPNWWGGFWQVPGTPYVDELVMLDLSDDTARVNALLSGQVDAVDAIPYAQAPVVETQGYSLFNVPAGNWRPFTMRVDVPPFNDVRVRQAMRLIVNRQQMVDQVLNGFGTIGNDLYSPQDPNVRSVGLEQREQDLDQAKSLLAQASAEDLHVELVTSNIAAGVVEASSVLATQAADAGVTIDVRKVDGTSFYGDQYLKYPFAVDWWSSYPYLDQAMSSDGPDAKWNETHWDDAEFNNNYYKALAEPDPKTRAGYEHEMMRIQHERGGYLIWGFPNTVDAHSQQLQGMVPTQWGQSFSDSTFWRFWLDGNQG